MNKYLQKIAALNPVAKAFARKVATSVAGDSRRINNVYNTTSGVVSPRMKGVYSSAEKTNISNVVKGQADKVVGTGQLYSGEAVRAARAGARLARFQAGKATGQL